MSKIRQLKLHKVVCAGFFALALLGCEVKGNFSVLETVHLRDSQGKEFTVQPGEFEAKLKAKAKNKFELSFKSDGKTRKLSMILPEDEIPGKDSDFSAETPAGENGQIYDLFGSVTSGLVVGDPVHSVRQCIWGYDMIPVCDGFGHCNYRRVPIYGRQRVVEHQETATRDYEFSFEIPELDLAVARFHAGEEKTYWVVDEEGPCRL